MGETFGELLKAERRATGLSLRAVAERAGLSASYICDLERGRRNAPTSTVIRIAEALIRADPDPFIAAMVCQSDPELAAFLDRRVGPEAWR